MCRKNNICYDLQINKGVDKMFYAKWVKHGLQ